MPGYILAKIADSRVRAIRKLIANANLYNGIEISREVDYNFEYKLQEGEWFKIDAFSHQVYFSAWLKNEFVPSDFQRLSRDEYKNIKWLVGIQNEGKEYLFQRVMSSSIIKNRKFIDLKEDLEII